MSKALWTRVIAASILLLAVEAASLTAALWAAGYAGRDRPGDQDFQSLGRAIEAFLVGAGVGIVLAVVAASWAARIVRCTTPKTAGLLTVVVQFAGPVGLAALRAPHGLVYLAAVATPPVLLWCFARATARGTRVLV